MFTDLCLFVFCLFGGYWCSLKVVRFLRKVNPYVGGTEEWIDFQMRRAQVSCFAPAGFVVLLLSVVLAVTMTVTDHSDAAFYESMLFGFGGGILGIMLAERGDPVYTILKVLDRKVLHLTFWLVAGSILGVYVPERWFAGYSHFFKAVLNLGPRDILVGVAKLVPAFTLTLFILGCALAAFTIIMGTVEEILSRKNAGGVGHQA